jgi:predicted MFS family arabinose efflux permease
MPEGGLGARFAVLRELDRSIAVLASISFISNLGVSIMLPLLPLFAVQLGATPGELGLMVSIFAVTQTIGQLGSGAMIARISPRRQMPLGQASYAAANFLIATATSAVPMIAFRALAGFGGGLSIIAERLYIARVADRAKLAFTNGVVSAAGSSGSVLGPTIGAILAINLRVPFIVVGFTATIAAISAILFLPAEPNVPPGTAPAATTPPQAALVAQAAVAAPLPSRWTRVRPLFVISLWNLAFSAAYGGWITTFGPYSTANLGMSPSGVSLIFAAFGVGSILLGPPLARIADRSGRRRMVAIGSLLVLLFFVAALLRVPQPVIYLSAALSGGGLAAAQSSWFALLSVATDGARRGRSFGYVTALSNLGVIVGASLASQVWEHIGLAEGLLSASVFLVLAALSLLFVPSDRRAG